MKFKNIKKIIKRPSLWFPDGKYNKKVDDLVKDMIRNRDKILLLDCSRYGIWLVYNQKVYWFRGFYWVTDCDVGSVTLPEPTLQLFKNDLNIKLQRQARNQLYRDLRPSRLTMLKFMKKIYEPAQRVLHRFGFRSVCKDGEFYEDGMNKETAPTSVIFNLSYCMAKLEAEDGKIYHYLDNEKTELK